MKGSYTFTMIKPTAVRHGHTASILKMITDAGFEIVAMKSLRLSKKQAKQFYIEHKDKPFYPVLTEFMSSGTIVAAILKKENAVSTYRELIGATDPEQAREGTIRKMFASSKTENAVHGSDADDTAERESNFFFSQLERI